MWPCAETGCVISVPVLMTYTKFPIDSRKFAEYTAMKPFCRARHQICYMRTKGLMEKSLDATYQISCKSEKI